MKKFLSVLLGFCFTLLFLSPAWAATVEINLEAGEAYVIPEGRRGTVTVEDESIVRVTGDTITALRPGRTVLHISGAVETDYSVLVLFSDHEPTVGEMDPAPVAPSEASATAPADPAESEPEEDGEPEIILQLPGETEAVSIPAPEEEAEEEPEIPTQEADPAAPAEDSPAYQAYDRSAVPDLINGALDLAFTQWEEDAAKGTKKFSRLGKYNKYSYWQCGSGSGCDIGWCGAFLGYVYDNAGVPMDKPADSVPHEGGVPYSVRAAGVGKIYTGFSNMERLSMVPQPGYFVIYGQQKGYAYKHIGLVADVDDLGGGQYLIKTVEGNMSSTIRRYCYLFDSNEELKNLQPCPEEYVREDAGINAYEHVKNWNITTFCQTWLPEEF